MSDFYGCLESTSFRVRDKLLFLADADVQRVMAFAKSDGFFNEDSDGYFTFGWYGQYPSWVLDTTHDEQEAPTDIPELLQRHIMPGDVCQIGISGNEKLRYIGGDMCWITSNGVAYLNAHTEWADRLTLTDLASYAEKFRAAVLRVTQ